MLVNTDWLTKSLASVKLKDLQTFMLFLIQTLDTQNVHSKYGGHIFLKVIVRKN